VQLREEQHIARALDQQKAEDERLATERLRLELDRMHNERDAAIENEISTRKAEWQGQLETELRKAAAAHSEHLEQVLTSCICHFMHGLR
jgi:mitofilin